MTSETGLAPTATEPADWSDRLARRTVGKDGSITAILALANATGLINLSGGFPAPEIFPSDDLAEIAADLIRHDPAVALQYAASEGIRSTREAIADHLLEIDGHRPAPDELMITSGGIDAVTLISRSLLDAGDHVAVEEPSYVGAVTGFAGQDAVLDGIAMDDEGLVVEALADLIAGGVRPKLLYTIPEFQNPTGRTMSLPRRQALVELCRKHRILIAEDVAYRELSFADRRLPSLYALGPDTVIQLGTFSKTFFPGVRLGWAAGPAPVIEQLGVAKQNTDQCAGAFGQRMVEEFLRRGHFGPQVERERAFYRQRGTAMHAALAEHMPDDVSWVEPTGGFFCWLEVPGVDTVALAAQARAAGLAFVPGVAFFTGQDQHSFLRLSFSRASLEDIDAGIRILATLVREAKSARVATSL
jgi:2-aminoadipate transaminase